MFIIVCQGDHEAARFGLSYSKVKLLVLKVIFRLKVYVLSSMMLHTALNFNCFCE